MIRVFQVYYPVRTLILAGGELMLLVASFVLAAVIRLGADSELMLRYENGMTKVLGITLFAILAAYYFDLYSPHKQTSSGETYFRLLVLFGMLSFGLAGVGYLFPDFLADSQGTYTTGMVIASVSVVGWRAVYVWLLQKPFLREPIFVLGSGPKAARFVEAIRERTDLGMDVVGWAGASNSLETAESLAAAVERLHGSEHIRRVIVAVSDRRGTLPVNELLSLRMQGVKIEDSSVLMEQIGGKIDIEDLRQSVSWLLFSSGFRVSRFLLLYKRIFSILLSFLLLILVLPVIALIALIIRLDSRGPVVFRQKRVGKHGKLFTLYKFRSMIDGSDRNGDLKPATDNDARFTRVGRWLRRLRLDELPQLVNILKGDMYFVGPRPFVPSQEDECVHAIPFYSERWNVRPGATGWAQVNRDYCATIEDNKDKLAYDLFYIKNASFGLDLLILFKTLKILLLGRGGK